MATSWTREQSFAILPIQLYSDRIMIIYNIGSARLGHGFVFLCEV